MSAVALWQIGDRGVGLEQQQGHGLAHGVAAPDDHRVLAAQVDAGGFDQLHAAVGRAGPKTRLPGHQLAGAQGGVAVDVLAGGDGLDHLVRMDVLWQWHLHQDAVDRRVGVERGDAFQQCVLVSVASYRSNTERTRCPRRP
jgi:hypothetical protein